MPWVSLCGRLCVCWSPFWERMRACSGMFATWWSYVSIFFIHGKAHAIYCVTPNYLSNENGTIQGNLSSSLQFYDFLRTVEGDCVCVCGFDYVCRSEKERFPTMKYGENTSYRLCSPSMNEQFSLYACWKLRTAIHETLFRLVSWFGSGLATKNTYIFHRILAKFGVSVLVFWYVNEWLAISRYKRLTIRNIRHIV